MATMKSPAAFAFGLWTGAMAVVILWLIYLGDALRAGPQVPPELAAQLAAKSERVTLLEQENARYAAESERLKQTVAELTSNLAARANAQAPQFLRRRVPFLRPDSAPVPAAAEEWMETAVATGDVQALPRLEQAAMENDEFALEAVVLMAERDGGAALTRVWSSGQLNFVNQVRATRSLAGTLELNAQAESLLRTLFNDAEVDMRLLFAAVDGIASPRSPMDLGSLIPLPQTGQTKPDYAQRVRLLDSLRALVADDRLREHEEAAREELMRRWAEAEPPAQ